MMTVTEKLEKARQARLSKKIDGVKLTRRNLIEVWLEDKFSLRKSINAKCYDCCHGATDEVKHCTVTACPLWFVRPYQDKTND